MLVFSVYDVKAGAYLSPFFARTAAVAVRMFCSAVRDNAHDFHKYAEDYSLFEIGAFDESSGELTGTVPEQRITALQALQVLEGAAPEVAR